MSDKVSQNNNLVHDVPIPVDLQCEYTSAPLGIDRLNPRFSWKIYCSRRGMYQIAYQVLVASSLNNLEQDIGDVWDSGMVKSAQSLNIIYTGNKLESKKTYYWKVRIQDETGDVSPYSQATKFETSFLNPDEWEAQWIACMATKPYPIAPMFRKEFKLTKEVAWARAYISGIGYYELRINGSKVGDNVLDPGWTDYEKRVLYTTYDVTDLLREEMNAVGIILGIGWYRFPKQAKQNQCIPQLIFQMHIRYTDGQEITIMSDGDSGWYTSSEGPIIFNSIYDGETYDARLEKTGWDMPGYYMNNDKPHVWKTPMVMEGPGGILVSQAVEPIKVITDIKPVNVSNPKHGVYVYDMGQNFAGWVRLKVNGPRGTRVSMKFAEILYDDNTVSQENLRSAKATDTYILKGQGLEVYEPRFTYHGFRYVQLEGFPGNPGLENITGRVVRSSVEPIGSFRCSNELINKIHNNVVWTESNNLHSVPTDCPQRDERLGWLNDMTVRAEEAIYNFNLAKLYAKWVDDISDAQGEKTGAIADVAPYIKFGRRPADPVASSYLIVPWLVYLHYGDRRIFEEHYEGLKKWVSFLGSIAEDNIIYYSEIGDWAPPVTQAIEGSIGAGAVSASTPGELISTGYYYFNAVLLSKIATILNKPEDEKKFLKLAVQIKKSFNDKFFNESLGRYGSGNQASNVFPLYLGLAPVERRQAVLDNIVHDVMEKHNGHITTGNLCTKYLIDVLTEMGRVDVAYKLVTQTTYPSWGYMISKGATTIWERWEYVTRGKQIGMGSHNHPMYGAVGAWFYKYLAGINPDENGPGYAKFVIKPYIVDELEFVEASVNTVRGKVVSNWRKTDHSLIMEVVVPCNSNSLICIPKFKPEASNFMIAEGNKIVWSDGQLKNNVEGIIGAIEKDKYVGLRTEAGSYCFEITMK